MNFLIALILLNILIILFFYFVGFAENDSVTMRRASPLSTSDQLKYFGKPHFLGKCLA